MTALALALLLAAAPAAAPAPPLELAPVPGHANLLALGVPEIPAGIAARLEQYQNTRAAGLLDVTADGALVLVATRFGNTAQLHVVGRPLGMREQITFSSEPIAMGAFLPGDPRTVFYLQDRGGGEFYQLYRLDRRTGRATLLTDGKSRHEALVVSRDGRRLAYSGTGRNGKDTDVYAAETARPEAARRVFEGEGNFIPAEFSPDGERLLVVENRAITDADLWLVDLRSGERRKLTEGKGSLRAAAFAADGKSVYAVTDRGGDFARLVAIDLAKGGAPRPLAPSVKWDVEELAVARDGSRVAFAANEDGFSRVYLLDPRTGRVTPAPAPPGVVGGMVFPEKRSDRLFLAFQTPTSPSDVWALDLRAGKLEPWTRSETGGLDRATFVSPELVRYPSSDGVTVPAFLYRPRGEGKRAVVVNWHGGPEGQTRPLFSSFVQYLVNELGVAVLQPNVRGSDGYGKAFLGLDDGVKREAALADVGATLDFAASRPDLDPARIAVFGGSYGGYLVLASAAFHSDRLRAAVDVVGISSIPTFLESTQAYRRDLRRVEYGDERVPEVRAVQERISPLNHVGRIQVPLLVVQGANDPRVPRSEAEQIVRAVRAGGHEVWYLLALDEGHGFQKKENRDFYTAAVMMFLERQLAPGAASGGAAPAPTPR
jgi:dipeptidyl aminopeptidase/acylaminoacyl peptidase